MQVKEILGLLEGTLLCGDDMLEDEITTACGSDLMSDVLAFGGGHSAMVTGLVNPQVIRTAEMMDIKCVIFGRGKSPTPTMIEMAQERSIVLMTTSFGMLKSCGLLYMNGLGEGE